MIVIIGLVILVAAVVVGVAGVLANGGSSHALTDHFAVFGYHVTGSTGQLFLYGLVVGAIGAIGLALLLTGARRSSRRGRTARRELKQSRRETAAITQDRDDLAHTQQRVAAADAARADAASLQVTEHEHPVHSSARSSRLFGHRPTASLGATPDAEHR
jgi:gas vesicle protein